MRIVRSLLCAGSLVACQPQDAPLPYPTSEVVETPAPFFEGQVSTVNGVAFSPDGKVLYTSQASDATDPKGRQRVHIVEQHFVDGVWTEPEVVAFSGTYTDYQPTLSPDGKRLFFTSTRPLPGTTEEVRQNIWYVARTGTASGTPVSVTELATSGWDGYAMPARDGTLYWVSEREGGRGGVDIWTAEPTSEGYTTPLNLQVVNTSDSDSDLYVDPDERFLIFNRYIDAARSIDLYISFRTDGMWTVPRPLDAVNTAGWELSPSMSPDGRYFFYNVDGIIWHVAFEALLEPADPL